MVQFANGLMIRLVDLLINRFCNINEAKDRKTLVDQAVNSALDEHVTSYFQVLSFTCSLSATAHIISWRNDILPDGC